MQVHPSAQIRPAARYAIALAASVIAVVIVSMLERVVGYVPLLLIAVVTLVHTYVGFRPAIFSIVVCTMGSYFTLGHENPVDERIHTLTLLALFPLIAASIVHLMETRRQQRKVVSEQLLELSTLLASMPESVIILDASGRVVDANPVAAHFAQQTRTRLSGVHYTELAKAWSVRAGENQLDPSQLAIARALRGETVHNESRTFVSPHDGSKTEAIVSASPMRNDDGNVIGALVLVRDVTELRHLQQQVADTERHLAIGQMASGLAHDFNNVLNTIVQATAVLRLHSNQEPRERETYLGMIDNAARRGAEIIQRVREYVRGGTGDAAPVDVAQLLQDALELTRPMWKDAKVEVSADLQPLAPIKANAADLRRVFTNLIINAVQAMPNGGRLRVECEARGATVVARVSDTGVGIRPEDQKNVFAPYYTTKSAGTGLGLSMAQKIVVAQGGKIGFSSEPGKGTTFTIELPAMVAEKAVA